MAACAEISPFPQLLPRGQVEREATAVAGPSHPQNVAGTEPVATTYRFIRRVRSDKANSARDQNRRFAHRFTMGCSWFGLFVPSPPSGAWRHPPASDIHAKYSQVARDRKKKPLNSDRRRRRAFGGGQNARVPALVPCITPKAFQPRQEFPTASQQATSRPFFQNLVFESVNLPPDPTGQAPPKKHSRSGPRGDISDGLHRRAP